MGENISYGCGTAFAVVAQLLVDDGVEGRGHRMNIMKAEFGVVGIATGAHASEGSMCVMNFAGGFGQKLSQQKQGGGAATEDEDAPPGFCLFVCVAAGRSTLDHLSPERTGV